MCHICRPHPWHREHNRQAAGGGRSLTLPESYCLQFRLGHPLWRGRLQVYHYSLFLGNIWFCQTAHRVCRKRNVPVMLGIQLSRCWVIIIDYQAKSVKIVSRIFLISSGTYSNALCNASAWTGVMYIFLNKWYPSGRERPPFRPRAIFIG